MAPTIARIRFRASVERSGILPFALIIVAFAFHRQDCRAEPEESGSDQTVSLRATSGLRDPPNAPRAPVTSAGPSLGVAVAAGRDRWSDAQGDRGACRGRHGYTGRVARMAATQKAGKRTATRVRSGTTSMSANPAASRAAHHCPGVRNPPLGR